mgnify:CR=1 FL=1
MAVIILAAIVLIAIVWVIATVNNFKRLEIKIDEALSGIEVALEKRYDMLTKLMDTAKGYMAHENDIFTKVVNLRKGMSVRDLITTDVQLSDMAGRLFAVAEAYPELRSSQVFVELSEGIRDAEEHLQAARRVYNSNVTAYNTAISMFPASLLAGGRTQKDFYEAEDAKHEDVKISF